MSTNPWAWTRKVSDKEIVTAVRRHYRRNGWPMTVREVGEAVGFSSSSTTFNRLLPLVADGELEQAEGKRGFLPADRACPHCGGSL